MQNRRRFAGERRGFVEFVDHRVEFLIPHRAGDRKPAHLRAAGDQGESDRIGFADGVAVEVGDPLGDLGPGIGRAIGTERMKIDPVAQLPDGVAQRFAGERIGQFSHIGQYAFETQAAAIESRNLC
ncbi:hypothetical protein SDC9_181517 [bioreactor metagenome]|uniref:Uncharacterized protein n=1 Tax=bioreactor metagenome TaxID=1076179 RepID=A0A645H4V1_9ZZZZ